MLYYWELLNKEEKERIAEGIKKGEALGGPYHLVLFPTDRCNLDCFFCYTEGLRRHAAELKWEILKKALDAGVSMGVKSVSLGGGGEPLVYRPLDQLLDYIRQHDLKISSIKTNGTALTPSIAEKLISAGLRRITISLNETDPDEYARMTQTSPHLYHKAMQGIANIVLAKNNAKSDCEISSQVFVWKDNYRRLPRMVKDLLPTGVDFIYVNSIDGLPENEKMSPEQKEEFKDILKDVIKEHAARLQLNLAAEGLQRFAEEEHCKMRPESILLPDACRTDHRVEYCYMGWYGLVIEGNGDCYACCHFAGDAGKIFGNLHEKSLDEIWNGEKIRAFRKEMRHLLLTRADQRLLPRRPRYIHPLCLERTACAFNFYLCNPEFYHEMDDWAKTEGGLYRAAHRLKSLPIRAARKLKRALRRKK